MSEIDFPPPRMFASGHEPKGERVNVYPKTSLIEKLVSALEPGELEFLKEAGFRKLFDIPLKPAWSGRFGLFLLTRQLQVKKTKELWVLFGGSPVRFSLREFKIVTGLPCGKYPVLERKKIKDSMGETPYYITLFGREKDVTVDRVISILKKKTIVDRGMRLKYACLAIVDGLLLPTSHKPKVDPDHADMVENLDTFLAYPWGRRSFESMITSIKERNVWEIAFTSVAVQGFFQALQLVLLEAVPSIQDSPNVAATDDSDSEKGVHVGEKNHRVTLKLGNARDLDSSCEVDVDPIIGHGSDFETDDEDLNWSDEDEDEKVSNMVEKVNKGFPFKKEMFQGGCVPSTLVKPTKSSRRGKSKGITRNKGQKRVSKHSSGTGYSHSHPGDNVEDRSSVNISAISHHLEQKIEDVAFMLKHHISETVEVKMRDLEKNIVDGVISWFVAHNVVDKAASVSPSARDIYHGGGGNGASFPGLRGDGLNVPLPDLNNASSSHSNPVVPTNHSPKEGHEGIDGDGEGSDQGIDDEEEEATDLMPDDNPKDNGTEEQANPIQAIDDDSATQPKEAMIQSLPEITWTSLYSLGLTQEDWQVPVPELVITPANPVQPVKTVQTESLTGVNEEHPKPRRTSKRKRIVSSRIDGRFKCDKRTNILIGHPSANKSLVRNDNDLANVFPNAMEFLSKRSSITIAGGSIVYTREVRDILDRKKPMGNKVMDALITYLRFQFRNCEPGVYNERAELLDSKFVSELTRLHPKFVKINDKDKFIFPDSLLKAVSGEGNVASLELYADADVVYIPFNFDRSHWVVLCVDLTLSKISVLDSDVQRRSDSKLKEILNPIATMLPYMFRQASQTLQMSQVDVTPFNIERAYGIPQISSQADSGVMAIMSIKAHAEGGMDMCKNLDLGNLYDECKNIVSALVSQAKQA